MKESKYTVLLMESHCTEKMFDVPFNVMSACAIRDKLYIGLENVLGMEMACHLLKRTSRRDSRNQRDYLLP
jgi:hypothetical protein